jgi:DNA-binding NtrC family response regulator
MDFTVLLVEDETTLREVMEQALAERDLSVQSTGSGKRALQELSLRSFSLVVTDIRLPGCSGMDLLKYCQEHCPDTAVILITAYATVEQAVEALKQGAHQYICKPFDMEELLHHVDLLLERHRLRGELEALRGEAGAEPSGILGRSPAMVQVRDLIQTLAHGTSNVLVTGSSGTGKSMAARAIHRMSPRRDDPFVLVNCAGIPDSLLESQLFGHEAGSFTGATHRHIGYFEQAERGTLLLDEIGDLPLTAQASILQVIQEHSFTRVGGTKPIQVDFRLICATNQPLDKKLEAGEFRLDLYYRLNVVEIRIPPLADRPEDIPLLADTFLRRYCAQLGKTIRGFSPEAWSLLLSHPFPGNARELENALERAVVLCSGDEIRPAHLPPSIAGAEPLLEREAGVPGYRPLRDALQTFEAKYIRRILEDCGGNRTKAAELLGISRKHLWTKIQQLAIDDDPKA